MKTKRRRRATTLIATFENGFAKDWFFGVGEFFKDHLDIFLTDRVVTETGPDGKKIKRTKRVWTQGDLFTFDQGHLFYDSHQKYMAWSDALKNASFVCQVSAATPDLLGADGALVDGRVFFDLWRVAKGLESLEHIGKYDKTQHEFVEYLKTGRL